MPNQRCLLVVRVGVHDSLSELILVIIGVGGGVVVIESLSDGGIVGVRHGHCHVGLGGSDAGDKNC